MIAPRPTANIVTPVVCHLAQKLGDLLFETLEASLQFAYYLR
jgi:hypothetical protein